MRYMSQEEAMFEEQAAIRNGQTHIEPRDALVKVLAMLEAIPTLVSPSHDAMVMAAWNTVRELVNAEPEALVTIISECKG